MSSTEISVQNEGFMQIRSLESAMQVSEIIAKSGFCPKGLIGKPGDVLVALQMGQELGLKPMQAIQNIAVINGRPSLWGDAMLAVCRQCPDFEFIREDYDESTKTSICTVKRRNEPEVIRTFSMDDAKVAGLLGKEGPWRQYPKRMLQMRARGFALRDSFPDTLRGIIIREEAEDMPAQKKDYSRVGAVIAGQSEIVPKIDQDMMSILFDKILASDSKESDICAHLKVSSIEELDIMQWKEVCRLLDKKILKNRKAAELEINQMLDEEPKSE